jgi:hypothetical protein
VIAYGIGHPGSGTDPATHLVFPPNALVVFLTLLYIGFLVVLAWKHLRAGVFCWCGLAKDECDHGWIDS